MTVVESPESTVTQEVNTSTGVNGHEPQLTHALRATRIGKDGRPEVLFVESTDPISGFDFPEFEGTAKIYGVKPRN